MRSWIIPTICLALTTGSVQAAPDVPSTALSVGALDAGDPRVEARLLTDLDGAVAGSEVRVGVLFTVDPGWHIYWRNPGQAGLSTEVVWSGPQWTAEPLRWPAPEVILEADGFITTYAYEDEVLLFSPARIAPDASGAVQIAASVDYLVCADTCIPGSGTLSRTLELGDSEIPASDEVVALFERFQAQIPVPAEEVGLTVEAVLSQTAVRPDDTFRLALAATACVGPPAQGESCPELTGPAAGIAHAFVPDRLAGITLAPAASWPHPNVYSGRVIALDGRAGRDDPGEDQTLGGVLYLERNDGRNLALDVMVPITRARAGEPVEPVQSPLLTAPAGLEPAEEGATDEATETSSTPAGTDSATGPRAGSATAVPIAGRHLSLWKALLFALLGGVILNVMPCVFPILSLKVASFVELAHKDRASTLWHGFAYTLGIVATMCGIAAFLISVQAAGRGAGIGMQFQYPEFVAVIGAVLVVFALNLFGVFEVALRAESLGNLADQASGARRSFFEGILAVVLSTPCTAPLLGAASGFALASGPTTILLVFITIGLGLALPFVLLTLAPGLARILPKPGSWMVTFKQFLGFTLLGTTLWLLWILGQSTGTRGVVQGLAFLLGVALATWMFGVAQRSHSNLRWAGMALAGCLLVVTGAETLEFDLDSSATAAAQVDDGPVHWEPWTEAAVVGELAAGRLVFVDFTAAWCTTCKVNEHLVLNSDRVVNAFRDYDVSAFLADWTRPDERISAMLARFGRGGVPMYLVYSPSSPDEPTLLPEVLTVDSLLDALRRAAPSVREARL